MSKVLVIGCGGVASVVIHKCCQVSEVTVHRQSDKVQVRQAGRRADS